MNYLIRYEVDGKKVSTLALRFSYLGCREKENFLNSRKISMFVIASYGFHDYFYFFTEQTLASILKKL